MSVTYFRLYEYIFVYLGLSDFIIGKQKFIVNFCLSLLGISLQMFTIGERLKKERNRLNISQTKMAEIGGVTKQSQINYESGKRYPDAKYLAEIAKIGVDIYYILLGNSKEISFDNNENDFVEAVESRLEKCKKNLKEFEINLADIQSALSIIKK